jgi:dTDP-4-dehydrorhamnose 3,5-epimerase-like enzyme
MNSINNCKIIDLPKFLDVRGNLSFLEQNNHIPFEIKRTYWVYDVPGGEARGGHAYISNEEFIVALSGSFDVVVDDGTEKQVFQMNRSYYGLYIPKGMWREINNFSSNSFALEFGSTEYNEDDYIRDYDEYLKWKRNVFNVQK